MLMIKNVCIIAKPKHVNLVIRSQIKWKETKDVDNSGETVIVSEHNSAYKLMTKLNFYILPTVSKDIRYC